MIKLLNEAWPILRGALLIFLLSVITFMFLIRLSANYVNNKTVLLKEHTTRFDSVSRKYLALDEEEKIVKEQYPRYVDFNKRGLIGDEQRLSWVESLKESGERLGIPALSYEIGSRKPYTPEYGLTSGAYQLFVSPMKLNIGMLNEHDLVRVLANLDQKASGLYSVKSCTMRREFGLRPLAQVDQRNISTSCELEWFTISMPAGDSVVQQQLQ